MEPLSVGEAEIVDRIRKKYLISDLSPT